MHFSFINLKYTEENTLTVSYLLIGRLYPMKNDNACIFANKVQGL